MVSDFCQNIITQPQPCIIFRQKSSPLGYIYTIHVLQHQQITELHSVYKKVLLCSFADNLTTYPDQMLNTKIFSPEMLIADSFHLQLNDLHNTVK